MVLASLPIPEFELIRPHLQRVELIQGTLLAAAGSRLKNVYFPLQGSISLVVNLSDGHSVEVAMIGRDSVYGALAAMDRRIALTNAMVQLPGAAAILDVVRFSMIANDSVAFRTKVIRHEQALFLQAQQTAACNASHSVESRLARWLLRARELSDSDTMPLTQEFLSEMIGSQRNSVSLVAHAFQAAGVIRYSRGVITILDLAKLKAASCECYETVREQSIKLLDEG